LIVVAIKRAGGAMIFNPPPQEKFQAGDILVAIGAVENLSRFEHAL
jgi:voltage-gated potassium channel